MSTNGTAFRCERCNTPLPFPGAAHTCEGDGSAGNVGTIPVVEWAAAPQEKPQSQQDTWISLNGIKYALEALHVPLLDRIAMSLPEPGFHDVDNERRLDNSRPTRRTDDEIKSYLRYRYAQAMLRESKRIHQGE